MDVSQQLNVKISWDDSGAQEGMDQLGQSTSSLGDIVSGIIVSDILINFYNSIVNIGQAAITSAANLQNIGVAAQYAFGSGSAGTQMLDTLNALSATTPFTNEQLDTLAIRMQNMGVPTKDITANLQNLANIASATGTNINDMSGIVQSSGDVLALAYQRGSIASRQLLGLENQGIPIADALVKVLNEQGAASATSASAQAKNAKDAATAQAQQLSLTQQLADAQQNLNLLQQNAPNSQATIDKYNLSLQKAGESVAKLSQTLAINQRAQGTTAYQLLAQQLADAQQNLQNIENSAPNTALAMEKYNFSVEKSQQSISDLNDKLTTNKDLLAQLQNPVGDITKSDLLNSSKNITISAQDLQKAFAEIAQGKDLGAAKAQAETYNGVLKNLSQQWQETVDAILGVSQSGIVSKGGLFDILQQAASNLLSFLSAHQKDFVTFGQDIINIFVQQVGPAIQTAFSWLTAHGNEISALIKGVAIDIANIISFIVAQAIPAITTFISWIVNNKDTILKFFNDLYVVVSDLAQILQVVVQALNATANFGGSIVNTVQAARAKLPGGVQGAFASGVTNFSGGLALVGEQGPEIVSLPSGSSVTPNSQIGATVNIYNPVVRSDNDIQAIIRQVKMALGRQNELAALGAI